MSAKKDNVPVETRCNSKDNLVMVNRLLFLSLGSRYIAENQMKIAEFIFSTCLRGNNDGARCSLLCCVELCVEK